MIDINLIPVALRKKSGGFLGVTLNLPREILWGVGFAAAAFTVLCHVLLALGWIVKSMSLVGLENQWKQVEPDRRAIDAIGNQVKDLNKKMKTMQELVKTRETSWSQKLNSVSDNLPKGVWLTKLIIDERSLVFQGMAVSKQRNEIVLIGNLNNALKKDASFAADFSNIEVNAINRSKFNNVDVSQFTLTAKLK